MGYTILACCALHNFCLDHPDNASQVTEETIREFEIELAGHSVQADDAAQENDDIEVVFADVAMGNATDAVDNSTEIVDDTADDVQLNYVPNTIGLSLEALRSAHRISQALGKTRRENMTDALTPLTDTAARHHRAMMLERQRQRNQRRIENRLLRQHARRRRHMRRN